MTKVHLIAAARPNFVKVAPLYHAPKATDRADAILEGECHKGERAPLRDGKTAERTVESLKRRSEQLAS